MLVTVVRKTHLKSVSDGRASSHACPCNLTVFIYNTAVTPFSLKSYKVLSWEAEIADFHSPLTHGPMQELFLNIAGIACMCEQALSEPPHGLMQVKTAN